MAFSPGSFQLSLVNHLETARFAVEKITDTFYGQDGKIYYKVRWQETWEPEEKVMTLCAPLVDDFWKDYYTKSQQQHQLSSEAHPNNGHQIQHGSHQPGDGLSQQPQHQHASLPSQSLAARLHTQGVEAAQPFQHVIIEHSAPSANSQVRHGGQPLHTSTETSCTVASPAARESDAVHLTHLHDPADVEFRFSSPLLDKRPSQQSVQSKMFIPVNPLLPRYQFLSPVTPSMTTQGSTERGEKVDTEMLLPGPSKSLACKVCKKQFSLKHNLLNHQLVHSSERPLACEHCGKRFRSKPGLIRHSSIHTGAFKPHQCEVCQKGFRERSNLKKHMLIHSDLRPHSCDICGARFRQLGHLLKHLLVHRPDKPHKCDVCGKGFKRKEHLKEHAVLHSGDFPFKCDECGKKFRFKTNLKVHVTSHTGRKDFVCDVCGKAFTGKANLTQHALIHEPDFNYTCEICGKKFKRKGHLCRHKDIHKNDRNLSCVFCKEQFQSTALLRRHLLIHTGNKPFVCMECGKRFAARSYLTQHVLIHKNETPFSCEMCEKKFRHKASLQKHLLSHSRNLAFNCEICGGSFAAKRELTSHTCAGARDVCLEDLEPSVTKKELVPDSASPNVERKDPRGRHKVRLKQPRQKVDSVALLQGDITSLDSGEESASTAQPVTEILNALARKKTRKAKKIAVHSGGNSACVSSVAESGVSQMCTSGLVSDIRRDDEGNNCAPSL